MGIDAENAVLSTALGLLQRGRKVRVIIDALGCLDKGQGHLAIRKMAAKGAKVSQTRELAGISHLKFVETFDRQSYLHGVGARSVRIIGKSNVYPKLIKDSIITSNLV